MPLLKADVATRTGNSPSSHAFDVLARALAVLPAWWKSTRTFFFCSCANTFSHDVVEETKTMAVSPDAANFAISSVIKFIASLGRTSRIRLSLADDDRLQTRSCKPKVAQICRAMFGGDELSESSHLVTQIAKDAHTSVWIPMRRKKDPCS